MKHLVSVNFVAVDERQVDGQFVAEVVIDLKEIQKEKEKKLNENTYEMAK